MHLISRFVLLIAGAVLAVPTAMAAYAEPAYEVLATYDDVELRRYAPYVVAQTTVQGSFKGARNQAFRRLFGFISGQNTRREEIAMTVPVQQSARRGERGQKIAMTVPVFSTAPEADVADGGTWTMEFVMPPGVALDALPVPKDERVALREIPAHTVAVYRYAGSTGERRFQAYAERLLAVAQARQLEVLGDPVQAVYNGPFTIGPLRRNEVLLPVRTPDDSTARSVD